MTQENPKLDSLLVKLDQSIQRLQETVEFAKPSKVPLLLDLSRRILLLDGGCAALEARAQVMEAAGVFAGSDWAKPHILVPSITSHAFGSGDTHLLAIEALSELRLLVVALGGYSHPLISAEQAHQFLTQVLAINLALLFTPPGEAERETQGRHARIPRLLLKHLAERIGYEHIIDRLIDEIWRILRQRPIQVEAVKHMVTQIAICQQNPAIDFGASGQGADRLVSSLYGVTQACREDPGLEVYHQRLQSMDSKALQSEATGFSRAMHDTGLVSPYHAVLIRHLLEVDEYLLAEAMGLSSTGRDCFMCYRLLALALIRKAVFPATAQSIYGLALMFERAILYQPAVAPSLWRQLSLPLSVQAATRLTTAFGADVPPDTRLLAGVLCLLGLPLGVGQGNNPTCQSARALSMWAYNDPDYLLQTVVWAARDDEIIMHFEGEAISSRETESGIAKEFSLDLDPVSLLVVPHLDRIYAEMGRRCVGRDGDLHRWVNPEFHGWWSGRGLCINIDVATGGLHDVDGFLRSFYAHYHPFFNDNQPLIHPQPAGIAITDSAARFIGWHAITLLRVALDHEDVMRVYFYNPNNDSGQNWGDGLVVSTSGKEERFGEASLPFSQFASRLYLFHFDPLEGGIAANVPQEELSLVKGYLMRSWGADRAQPEPALQVARDDDTLYQTNE